MKIQSASIRPTVLGSLPLVWVVTWLMLAAWPLTAQGQAPVAPGKLDGLDSGMTVQQNECRAAFEALWSQNPSDGSAGRQLRLRCEANPWVQWTLQSNSRQTAAASNTATLVETSAVDEVFFHQVEQLEQAVHLAKAQRLAESSAILRNLLQTGLNWPELHYNLGLNHAMAGDRPSAQRALIRALQSCGTQPCRFSPAAVQQWLARHASADSAEPNEDTQP
jgi:hypothetical protein